MPLTVVMAAATVHIETFRVSLPLKHPFLESATGYVRIKNAEPRQR